MTIPSDETRTTPTTAPQKPYRIHATVKNNRLWTAIAEMFPWVRSQSDAAKAFHTSPSLMGQLLNMQHTCGHLRHDGTWVWSPLVVRIAERLAHPPDYLFDRRLYAGQVPSQITVAVGPKELPLTQIRELAPSAYDEAVAHERTAILQDALAQLPPREQYILERRFGLNGGDESTLEEIGQDIHLSRNRVSQIKARALAKLRHPRQSREFHQKVSLS